MHESPDLTVARVRERGQGSAHLDADPTYARTAIRHISPFITFAIVRYTRLSADAITALAIASGVAGGILTAFPSMTALLAAVILLQLAYLFDVADGEVARVRGTSSKRGTYLDLIGHFIQNRALYGGSTFAFIVLMGYAWWAIVIALLGVGFASAFGELARMQVLGGASSSPHGTSDGPIGAIPHSTAGRLHWYYRRIAFLWNYPASMNLFCIALLADTALIALGQSSRPVLLPWVGACFAVTLTLKQLMNAIRLLASPRWAAPR